MDWSPSCTALLVERSAESLNLYGGAAYFAVLWSHPDGRHGRYILKRPLSIGTNGNFAESGWYVPSSSHVDWKLTFASNGQWNQVPAGPDLRYIEAVEIVIVNGSLPPEGKLKIRDLKVLQ